jgi:hypothetical protein
MTSFMANLQKTPRNGEDFAFPDTFTDLFCIFLFNNPLNYTPKTACFNNQNTKGTKQLRIKGFTKFLFCSNHIMYPQEKQTQYAEGQFAESAGNPDKINL